METLTNVMNCWIDRPELIPTWITHGRTVLIPKSKELSDEKNYRPITCLNTSYKIFTGLLSKHMKNHADRNEIWDKSQLGTCSGVLGTVYQLLIDSAIMDEVRERKRNLATSFYDYQKSYDMVGHNWMIRVFTWLRYPSKLINVLTQLMDGWKTKLEVNGSGEIKTSRWIRILKLVSAIFLRFITLYIWFNNFDEIEIPNNVYLSLHSQKTKTLCRHGWHFLYIYCFRLSKASSFRRKKCTMRNKLNDV